MMKLLLKPGDTVMVTLCLKHSKKGAVLILCECDLIGKVFTVYEALGSLVRVTEYDVLLTHDQIMVVERSGEQTK